MKSRFKKLDFHKIKTYSIQDRLSKVTPQDFAKTVSSKSSIKDFLDSLPQILIGKDFKEFIQHYRKAIEEQNTIIWMIGAHTIKCGLNPLIIELMKEKKITHLAMNGAGAIHDVEIAMWGKTSEDVASGLLDGSFGMARETAEFINESLTENKNNDRGYGEILGEKLVRENAKNKDLSLLVTAFSEGIPLTLHPALGTEIVHQHPNFNGAAFGEKSLLDFQVFSNSLSKLKKGSIVCNIGSAVILPEVFLKALTVVRNLGYPAFGFYTAVFDMIRHYRPTVNVMQRPTQNEGKGYYFIGHHEIMIPLLAAALR
jgi:hypothetical protein